MRGAGILTLALFAVRVLPLLLEGARPLIKALAARAELGTPVSSLVRIREGAFLIKLGASPYQGSAYHGAPLLAALHAALPSGNLPQGLPAVVGDAVAALCLWAAARRVLPDKGAFWTPSKIALLYLANPFTLLTCMAGSSTSLENAAVMAALYGGVSGHPLLAGFALACGAYLAAYPLLLSVAAAMLLARGAPPASGRRAVLAFLAAMSLTAAALYVASEVFLGRFPGHGCLTWATTLGDPASGAARRLCALGEAAGAERGLEAPSPASSYGNGPGRGWVMESIVAAATTHDLTPNIGLWWYFFAEMFEEFRAFFAFVAVAAVGLLPVPLALRLPARPVLVFALVAGLCAVLRPYPSVGHLAQWLCLLPSAGVPLGRSRLVPLGIGIAALAAPLCVAMRHAWLTSGAANANFYYASTLVLGGWQVLLLLLLIQQAVTGAGEESRSGGKQKTA